MDSYTFSETFNELLLKESISYNNEKASADCILEAERSLDCTLPDEYKYFLQNYGAGHLEPGNFTLTAVLSVDRNSLFSLFFNDQPISLKNFVPVASDEWGDMYGFKITNKRCGNEVFRYDHEIEELTVDEYKSFFEFILSRFMQCNEEMNE